MSGERVTGTEWLDPSAAGVSGHEAVLRRRHEAAYAFARRFAEGERVLDVACGVGYGARVLGEAPSRYLGVDRSREALRTAAGRAGGGRVGFVRGDVAGGLPFATGACGLVLAFQILEHVPVAATPAFLGELRRVCAPDGRVVLTTPNRRHRLFPFQRPWNPYHVREFGRDELSGLLEGAFSRVEMRGLRADEELERRELARVRRRRLLGLGLPLWRLLPAGLRSWLRGRLPGGSAGGPPADRVTVDRFRVEEDPEGEGLDLVAVCRP